MQSHKLALADSVVVIRGSGFNPKKRRDSQQLVVERDMDGIGALARLVCDVIPGSDATWMEWPVVSFAFMSGKGVLGEIGLLRDGRWVRHPDVDLEVRDPVALDRWLEERGVRLS